MYSVSCDLGTAFNRPDDNSLDKLLGKLLGKLLLVWSGRMHDKGTDMPSSCFVITVNFGQY